ncbi:MAG: thiamine pyrophosphate-binding protein [Gammaproteobacteria bacterium]|nr:thiamine pyrophosphate-binding protein [Gammaproteobacteria bacterium]
MESKRCADVIVSSLVDQGVDTVFGLPGAQTYSLFDALRKRQDDIKTYCSRHEQGAAYMAFGYAKSTGKVGVYAVVPGGCQQRLQCTDAVHFRQYFGYYLATV